LPTVANFREVLPVSVEAISWALNLAPVPRDRGGRPNPACKAVLIGLANHAGPDGKESFPAVRTLIRYTCLSERTVRTALDRLQAEGIIQASGVSDLPGDYRSLVEAVTAVAAETGGAVTCVQAAARVGLDVSGRQSENVRAKESVRDLTGPVSGPSSTGRMRAVRRS
jgi:Helix-turn-helix domain